MDEMQKNIKALDGEGLDREISFAEGFDLEDAEGKRWLLLLKAEKRARQEGGEEVVAKVHFDFD